MTVYKYFSYKHYKKKQANEYVKIGRSHQFTADDIYIGDNKTIFTWTSVV